MSLFSAGFSDTALADIDNSAVAVGTYNGNTVTSTPSTQAVPVNINPAYTFVKSAAITTDTNTNGLADEGDVITYTFTFANTGNQTLTNLAPSDTKSGLSAIACNVDGDSDADIDTLAPGTSETCSATYTVTAADIASGEAVENAATSSATGADGTTSVPETDDPSVGDNETSTPINANPAYTFVKSAAITTDTNTNGLADEGDVITYTFTFANTGNQTLTNLAPSDTKSGLSVIACNVDGDSDADIDTLAPGTSETCSATYTVTAADIASGEAVENAATSSATGADGTTSVPETDDPSVGDNETSTPINANPAYTFVKSAAITTDTNTNGLADEGDVITYTFTFANTGNQTLTNLAPSDTKSGLSVIACNVDGDSDADIDTLAPGTSETCSATYTVTAADIASGEAVENAATSSATGADGTTSVPETDDPSVGDNETSTPINANPAYTFVKSAAITTDTNTNGLADEGDVITYTFTFANTGNQTLTNLAPSDTKSGLSVIACNVDGDSDADIDTLAPGTSETCSATYTVTAADIASGEAVENAATSSATGADGTTSVPETDDPSVGDNETSTPINANPAYTFVKSAAITTDTNTNGLADEGDVITYTFTFANTGNQTLTNLAPSDTKSGLSVIACNVDGDSDADIDTLAPGTSETCSATYTVTAADIASGEAVENAATSSATGADGTTSVPETDDPSVGDNETSTPINANPAYTFVKSAAITTDTNTNGLADEGDVITYTFTFANTGNQTLTNLAPSDTKSGLSVIACNVDGDSDADIDTLAPGTSETCSATYTVTAADIASGEAVENAATSSATGADGTTSVPETDDPSVGDNETSTPINANPAYTFVKSAAITTDTNTNGLADEGDVITYTFTFANTGNQTLTNLAPSDTKSGLSVIACNVDGDSDADIDTLAPGTSETCSATYTVTAADIASGEAVENAATSSATGADGTTSVPETDDPSVGDNETSTPINANPAYTFVKSAAITTDTNTNGLADEGDVITYTFTFANTGNQTLTNLAPSDTKSGLSVIACNVDGDSDADIDTLAPGSSETCSATYTVTAADIASGEAVENAATSSATGADGTTSVPETDDPSVGDNETSTPINANPAYTFVKSAAITTDTNTNGLADEGDVITYTFTFANTGNQTLTNLAPSDTKSGLSVIACNVDGDSDADIDTLAPGTSETCSATYTVTAADIASGEAVENAATSSATGADGTTSVPETDDPSVGDNETSTPINANPAYTFVKSAAITTDTNTNGLADEGDVITYTFTFANTGNQTLTNLAPSDTKSGLSVIACNVDGDSDADIDTLAPGTSETCSATYTVTAADIASGEAVENAATSSATGADGTTSVPETDDPSVGDNETSTPINANPAYTFVKSAAITTDTNTNGLADEGDVITYTFTFANTGNQTLTNLAPSDTKSGLSAIACNVDGDSDADIDTLAPGTSETCSATYTVTAADIASGEAVENAATSSATGADGTTSVPETDDPSVGDNETSTPINANPAYTFVKSAAITTDTNTNGLADEGDVITYTFTFANTGNQTLTNLAPSDTKSGLSVIACNVDGDSDADIDTLAPGTSETCSATYTVTGCGHCFGRGG